MYAIQIIFTKLTAGILSFYRSPSFVVVEIIVGIYVLIVLIDIVLLILQRKVGANWRQMRYGVDIPKEFVTGKSKMKIVWQNINKRLEGGNQAEYKVAIIEADNIIDDLLKRMGYKGANMAERIAGVPIGQLEFLGDIKEAHDIRNRIIHEEDFVVDKEFAQEVLKKYEHLLRHFEVLE